MSGRNPGVHVLESHLREFLKRNYPGINVEEFTIGLKAYGNPHRLIIVSNAHIEKKVENLLSSSRLDADTFAKYLYAYRKKARHIGVQPIKPGSRDWTMVKKITQIATDFCQAHELSIDDGFKIFIRIGLTKMQKFSILKLFSLGEAIEANYTAEKELAQDKTPGETKQGYDYYNQYIINRTGISTNYDRAPEKYVYFYWAKLLAREKKVSLVDYIKSQFNGFEWRGDYPDPTQLIGDKAVQRLSKYMFNKTSGNPLEQKRSGVDLKKIMKIK